MAPEAGVGRELRPCRPARAWPRCQGRRDVGTGGTDVGFAPDGPARQLPLNEERIDRIPRAASILLLTDCAGLNGIDAALDDHGGNCELTVADALRYGGGSQGSVLRRQPGRGLRQSGARRQGMERELRMS